MVSVLFIIQIKVFLLVFFLVTDILKKQKLKRSSSPDILPLKVQVKDWHLLPFYKSRDDTWMPAEQFRIYTNFNDSMRANLAF